MADWTHRDEDGRIAQLAPIARHLGSEDEFAHLTTDPGGTYLTREDAADLARAAAGLAGLTVVDHPVPAVPPPPFGEPPPPYGGEELRGMTTERLARKAGYEASVYCTHAELGSLTPHNLLGRDQHYARANAHRKRLDAIVAELTRRAESTKPTDMDPAEPGDWKPDPLNMAIANRADAARAAWGGRRRGETEADLWRYTDQLARYIATGEWPA